MRKKDKMVLWPVYFDSTKTRVEGRRIPKNLATPSPKMEEIRKAAERMGLESEVVFDAEHPSAPWQKTGLITIYKRGSKTHIMRGIAKELLDIRAKSRM